MIKEKYIEIEDEYDRKTKREIRAAAHIASRVADDQQQYCTIMDRFGYKTEWDQNTKTIDYRNNGKNYTNHELDGKKWDFTNERFRPRLEEEKKYTMEMIEATLFINRWCRLFSFEELEVIFEEVNINRRNGVEHPLNLYMDSRGWQ